MGKKNTSSGKNISKGVQNSGWIKKGGYQSGKPNSPNRVPPQGASPTKPVASSGNSSSNNSSGNSNK